VGITYLYIDLGLYYKQVKRYLDIFQKENIKIIIFEEMKADFQIFGLIFGKNFTPAYTTTFNFCFGNN